MPLDPSASPSAHSGRVTRKLRSRPDLNQLKRQAKELQEAVRAGDRPAVEEALAWLPGLDPARIALHQAQSVVARSYGFTDWAALKCVVDGFTIRWLSEAVWRNDMVEADALLRARPELVNMAMSYTDERTPLHLAVLARLPDMVRLLMRQGADPDRGIYPHRDATTARVLASERGWDDIAALLAERHTEAVGKAAQEVKPPRRTDAAKDAVIRGDIAWLRERHSAGKLRNVVDWREGGLLTVAVEHDRGDVLDLLLDFGFDPDERATSGDGEWLAESKGHPLWRCAALGRTSLAERLLRRGADPNAHVDSSGSSVYSAYSHRQPEMIDLLLRHGGVVTPDIAAIYRQTEVAKRLLADDTAETLLRYGAMGGCPEIVRLALERVTWPRDDERWFGILVEPLSFWHHIPWLYAGEKGFSRTTYIECFQMILSRCDAQARGAFGTTVLHEVAAMRDYVSNEEVLEFATAALEAGARVDLRDELLLSTPLGWACRWGRRSLAELLLRHGADAVERDAPSWATPLAWAQKKSHPEIAALVAGT